MALFSENLKTNGLDAKVDDSINKSNIRNIENLAKNLAKRFGECCPLQEKSLL